MRIRHVMAAAALSLAAGATVAVAAAPSAEGGRFQLAPAEGGFLRLDRETGATAFCRPDGEGYACRPTAEQGGVPADRAATIEKRVGAIEERLKALGSAPAPSATDPTLELPSDQQVNRVMGFIERAAKRLREMAESLQRDEPPADRQRL